MSGNGFMAVVCTVGFLAALAGDALASPSSECPIGVFDSGTGGLTVLERILTSDEFDNATGERRPDGVPDFANESFVYFGDQANMPYGLYDAKGKADFLRELVVRDTDFVLGGEGHEPSKIVVIACNTATAYGLAAATERAKGRGVKVIGVVNAGVEAAMDAVRAKAGMPPFAIGVMATPGTIASGVYERTLRAALAERGVEGCDIVNRGGIGLAEAVENDEPGVAECARTNFAAMVESYRVRGGKAPMRAVIMGCTHYPFVLRAFREELSRLRADPLYAGILAEDLKFVDPAAYTAVQCYRSMRRDGLLNAGGCARPRVKPYLSVGRNGPLSPEVKYGRATGLADIGTVIVPMSRDSMSAESVGRLAELLPACAREIF